MTLEACDRCARPVPWEDLYRCEACDATVCEADVVAGEVQRCRTCAEGPT